MKISKIEHLLDFWATNNRRNTLSSKDFINLVLERIISGILSRFALVADFGKKENETRSTSGQKSNCWRSLLFIIIMISLAELPLTVMAQVKLSKPQQNQTNQPKKKRSTWEAILTLFKGRKAPNLGSRGICPISPGLLEDKNIIWNNQPLFLWQGNSLPLEIRVYSPFNPKQEQQVIWRKKINSISSDKTFQGIPYTGLPLELGKIYDWELFNQSDKSKVRRSFQVMNIKEHEQISQELKRLEVELRLQQATDEDIALERANYFAQKNLWSDALKEIFSVQNPSLEFRKKIEELLSYLC